MNIKVKMANELRSGDEMTMLIKNTDISYLQARVISAEPYAKSESDLVREEDGVTYETVITYEFTMYGKTYSRKIIVPDTDVVLVVK